MQMNKWVNSSATENSGFLDTVLVNNAIFFVEWKILIFYTRFHTQSSFYDIMFRFHYRKSNCYKLHYQIFATDQSNPNSWSCLLVCRSLQIKRFWTILRYEKDLTEMLVLFGDKKCLTNTYSTEHFQKIDFLYLW